MEEKTSRKRRRERCGHCDQILSSSQFYNHKRLYFKDGIWTRDSNDVTNVLEISYKDNEISSAICSDHETDKDSQKDGWLEDEDWHLILETSESESSSDANDDDDDADVQLVSEPENEEEVGPSAEFDGCQHDTTSSNYEVLLSKLMAMILLIWQSVFRISDSAISALLLCLKMYLHVMGNVLQIPFVLAFADALPKTLYSLRKYLGIQRDSFTEFVVCPKCMSVYTLEESIHTEQNGTKLSNKCRYVPFHSHPHKRSVLKKKMWCHPNEKSHIA